MFGNSKKGDARLTRYDHVIVHVTATRPSQDFDDGDIDAMHRARGFNGCGYNAIIKRDGTWLDSDMGRKTRPIGEQGAHVGDCGAGWNGRSFGISLIGGVDEALRPDFNMTDAQMRTLEQGIGKFLSLHPRAAAVRVIGHRDLIRETGAPPKACPCFDVIPWWSGVSGRADPGSVHDEDGPGHRSLVDRPPFWTVASGDSLTRIASTVGLSIPEIMELNPEIEDPDKIKAGQVLRLR